MSGFTSRLRHRRVLQPAADKGWAATGSGSGTTGGATAAESSAYGAGAGRIR